MTTSNVVNWSHPSTDNTKCSVFEFSAGIHCSPLHLLFITVIQYLHYYSYKLSQPEKHCNKTLLFFALMLHALSVSSYIISILRKPTGALSVETSVSVRSIDITSESLLPEFLEPWVPRVIWAQTQIVIIEVSNLWRIEFDGNSAHNRIFNVDDDVISSVPAITELNQIETTTSQNIPTGINCSHNSNFLCSTMLAILLLYRNNITLHNWRIVFSVN